ncbi:asparagine synthase-related protein [Dyella sp.]|uniref:asparagine synthase-related protein n=1 Tax=Dyella sp. TaxID=1869338 RepID=UPI003F7F1391
MSYDYMILLGTEPSSARMPTSSSKHPAVQEMLCQLVSPVAKVFVPARTPTLHIPGRGLLIGRVFDREGKLLNQHLELNGSARDIMQRLLESTWGEYIAVLFDSPESGEITVLREPSGGVQCVYSLRGGEGFITSDISLATEMVLYHKEVDWDGVAHTLNFPYLRVARTALKGVSELLPGTALTYRETGMRHSSAWSPWRFMKRGTRHENPVAAADEVRETVSGVVEALALNEEAFLVELSGGLDSSVVATCLRDFSQQATFCTLVMPVSGTDERPYAQLVTDALNTQLRTVEIAFDSVTLEYPVPQSSVTPAVGLLQNAVNSAWERSGNHYGINSFFSGGGGDTVFGYLKTAAPAADAFLDRGPRAGFSAIGDLAALHQCTVFKAGRLTFKKMLRRPRTGWKADSSLLNRARVPAASDPHPWIDAPPGTLPGDYERVLDLIGTQLFRVATPRGAGRSMHFPLLSQPVMEACLKVPSWMWITNGRNRAVARQAFADRLPRGILDRRSKGSYTGYMAAVYAHNRERMRELLEEGELCRHDLIDRAALRAFFARELAPRDLSFLRVIDLCAAENWVRQQGQEPSAARASA